MDLFPIRILTITVQLCIISVGSQPICMYVLFEWCLINEMSAILNVLVDKEPVVK